MPLRDCAVLIQARKDQLRYAEQLRRQALGAIPPKGVYG